MNLARIALEIGRDADPEIEVESYLERIQDLADRARGRYRPGAKIRDILAQINWVLFVEEEFRGNHEDYYDPRNSYLNEVLDRGLGIPISLSVLYQTLAERLGLAMAGVDLPLHFMLRVDDQGQAVVRRPILRRGCLRSERLPAKTERDRRAPRELARRGDRALFESGSDRADAQEPQGELRTGRGRGFSVTHPAPFDCFEPAAAWRAA